MIEANDRDPILIGKRFVLVPADRIVLPIDAGMAFGSGRHETTQLCLEAMERFIGPGETIYDVGCGSGILALAAIKLGAGCVVATDIDEAAIRNARAHFPGPLFIGSADGFRSHSADVVISNITGRVNDEIARDLKRIVKPAGLVIICGFTTETAPGLFRPHETLSLNEWQCWICKPADISEADGVSLQTHDPVWWL